MKHHSNCNPAPQQQPLDDLDPASIAIALDLLRLIRTGAVSRFIANTEAMSFAFYLDRAGYIELTVDQDLDGDVYKVAGCE